MKDIEESFGENISRCVSWILFPESGVGWWLCVDIFVCFKRSIIHTRLDVKCIGLQLISTSSTDFVSAGLKSNITVATTC